MFVTNALSAQEAGYHSERSEDTCLSPMRFQRKRLRYQWGEWWYRVIHLPRILKMLYRSDSVCYMVGGYTLPHFTNALFSVL